MGLEKLSGTASQLISRLPSGLIMPGPTPLFGPRAARKPSTVDWIALLSAPKALNSVWEKTVVVSAASVKKNVVFIEVLLGV